MITSRPIQFALGALVFLLLLCLAFSLGVKAGERRARHYSDWSQHRSGNFPGGMMNQTNQPNTPWGRGMGLPMRPTPMPFSHGTFGHVISTSSTTLTIQGRDKFEQTVIITPQTVIRSPQGNATTTDIQQNMDVSVFGESNTQGQIEARLIRLSPSRP